MLNVVHSRLVNTGSALTNSSAHSPLAERDSNSERASLMTASQQSSVVQPMLTDLYQISMAYAYWKANKHQGMSTFDLYFLKNRTSDASSKKSLLFSSH
jgi:hypothetical protein